MSDRFQKSFLRAQERAAQRNRIYATLGRQNSAGHVDGNWSFQVPGRPTFLFVTMRLSSGAQTVIPARNDAGVPWTPRLPVELMMEGTTYVIVRKSGRQDMSKAPPSDPSGMPAHTHNHSSLLELGDDDHPQYHNDARGDIRYYTKAQHVALSAGAGDAGKPIVLDAGGKLDATFLDSEDIQDVVGAFFTDSSSVDFTYTDGSNTITAAVIDEYIQDVIGAMVSGNTETDIAVTYDDTGAKLNFVVSTNTEAVQDIIGAFLVDSSSIDFTYNDAGNSMTVAVIDEYIQDVIGAMVAGNTETNIAVTYDDATAKLNFVVSTDTEAVQDVIGALLVDSTSIDFTYDDAGNAMSVVVIDEYIQDTIGAMVSGNTETNIAVTYDDTTGKLNFVVSTDTEAVQDIIGAFLVDSSSIDFTYNDAGNAITVAVIDEYIQDLVGAMVGGTETGISVTYDDATGTLIFDAQTAGDARYGRLASANSWSANQTISGGNQLLFDDPDVAHGMTSNFPLTTTYGVFAPISGTAGGLFINGASDTDATALFFLAAVNAAAPANFPLIFRGVKSSGTGVQALAAAEPLAKFQNNTTDVVWILANGDTNIATKLSVPTLAARTSAGLTLTDDGGNIGYFLKDAGLLAGFGGVTNPTTAWHFQRPTNRQEIKVQQYVAGQDLSRLMFTDETDALIFSFETASGAYRHTFADGFVPADDYTALYTGLNSPIYLGTDDLVRLAILGAGNVFVGLRTGSANILGMRAGDSTVTNDAAVGGLLYATITQTGNVGTGEDDLASYSVPANTLAVNNQSLYFEAFGTYANNANAKTLRVRFGTSGTTLAGDASLSTGAAGSWVVRGRIIRAGASSQKAIAEIHNSNTSPGQVDIATLLNQTLSGAVSLRITGEATSNNDIVLESFRVYWEDANT